MDEVEIINLHKRCNKTGTKTGRRTPAKAIAKAPRSGYHLFLREQLGKMTREDRKNYSSIVSRRWKEIKENPAKLSAYNNRVRQMRDEAEKPMVNSMKQQTRQPKKAPKTPEFIESDVESSDDSDDEDSDNPDDVEPMVKRIQPLSKISAKNPR